MIGDEVITRRKEALKKRFQEVDKDGDGTLDVSELATLLRKGKNTISNREIKLLFAGFDVDGNGRIDFEEFVDFVFGDKLALVTPNESALRNPDMFAAKLVKAVEPRMAHTRMGRRASEPSAVVFLPSKGSIATRRRASAAQGTRRPSSSPSPAPSDGSSRRGSKTIAPRPASPPPTWEIGGNPRGTYKVEKAASVGLALGDTGTLAFKPVSQTGAMAEALSDLFFALDRSCIGVLSYDESREARRLLASLLEGDSASAAAKVSIPRGQMLPAAFEHFALRLLGVFDCPSDLPLAEKVLALARSVKPPFAPLRHFKDADCDALTEVIDFQLFLTNSRTAADAEVVMKRDISHIVAIGGDVDPTHDSLVPSIEDVPVSYHIEEALGGINECDRSAREIYVALDRAVEFVHKAMRDYHRVLVHCSTGVSSSPAVVMAYLIAHKNLSLRGAFEFLTKRRPVIWPTMTCMEVLIEWESMHNKGRSLTMRLPQYRLWSSNGELEDGFGSETLKLQ